MNRERDQRGSRGPRDQRDPRTQRDQRDEYRQHSPAWIRAQRRKRKQILRRRIMIGGAIICLILIIGVIRLISGLFGHGKEKTTDTVAEESTFQASDISVNGISLKGMTKSEAKAAIEAKFPWNVKISYNGESVDADNMIDTELDAFLDGISADKNGGEYTFSVEDSEDLQSAAAKAAADAAAKWDVKAKNSSISEYDAASDKFLFTDGTPGKAVDQEKLASDLVAAVTSGNYDAVIQAEVNETAPELSEADAREQYQRLSTFTTETTANEKRNTNVKLAAQAINGTIVQPGEEFSFNKVVGPRTAEKGYQEAAAYSGGEVVQEPGGGVCQVSSTMYRVAFQSGMQITFRRSHTFEPNYVTPGQDAAISWDIPDFRFINTSKAAIGIRANYSNRKMTVSFYGVPVLEEGITWSLESEKTDELPPPEPTYVEDPTLDPGTEVTQKAGTNGSRWITYKIVSKNGTVVEKTEDHAKTYKGHAAVIRRNTGSVKVAASETTVAESTSAAIDGMPDGYVPGESVAPESSAAATTAAPTSGSETKSTHSETKSSQSETTAASTTAAATTAATEAATTAAPTTAASTTAAAPNGPGEETTATPSAEAIGNIAGFPGDGN